MKRKVRMTVDEMESAILECVTAMDGPTRFDITDYVGIGTDQIRAVLGDLGARGLVSKKIHMTGRSRSYKYYRSLSAMDILSRRWEPNCLDLTGLLDGR